MTTKTESKLPAIFAACCTNDDTWYDMNQPWRHGGYIYATDGRICVRMKDDPAIELPLADEKPNLPPAHESFRDAKPSPMKFSIEGIEIKIKMAKCLDCGGAGKQSGICDKCDGTGFVECPECRQKTECDECDGTGECGRSDRDCPFCNGAKVKPDLTIVHNFDGKFGLSYCYIDLLQRHGVTHVSPNREKPETLAVSFSVGEVEGLVMPNSIAAGK